MLTGTITAAEKRAAVVKKYEEILGRNKYSQSLRSYCYKKYKDGRYYSDCSSSVTYAYKEAGFGFGILNTVGIYQSDKLVDVPVVIEDGVIQNPGVLRPCDMLLFAGSDSSRAYAGYVGHVEMAAKIEGTKVTIYGHGSGTPRATEMNAYCKSRYAKKTSTKLGHKGLIRVRRFIRDDEDGGIYLCKGMEDNAEVKALQQNLMRLGYELPEWGDDGDFGSETQAALERFQTAHDLPVTGIYDAATDKVMRAALMVTGTEAEREAIENGVTVKPGTWNVRSGPGSDFPSVGVVKGGSVLEKVDVGEWTPVMYDGEVRFIGPSAVKEG